ncbi:MAG: hypothetical protein IJ619_01705 [Eubacterium sp.]|nr:hypothetical protein [Eubacterium sp.]
MKQTNRTNIKAVRAISVLIAACLIACAVLLGFEARDKSEHYGGLNNIAEVFAASGINGNEARVLAVCRSTFKYRGKYYRAKAEYIAQATAKMNEDDVNLTPEQANKAINRIYGSILRGINEGYLYEVKTEPVTEKPTTEATTESTTEKTEATTETTTEATTEKTTEETGGNNGGDTGKGKDIYGVDIPVDETGAIILDQIPKSDIEVGGNDEDELFTFEDRKTDDISERPDEDKSNGKVVYDEDEGALYVGDKNTDTLKKLDRFIPVWLSRTLLILGIVCSVITIYVFLHALISSCFIWSNRGRKGKRKGHTKRRKLRKFFRKLLMLDIALELIIIMVLAVAYLGIFRTDSVMANLNTSGYFRYEYALYLTSTENIVESDASGILNYEEFLFKARKEVTTVLSDPTAKVKDSVLNVSVADYISKLKAELMTVLRSLLPAVLIGLIINIVLIIFVDGIRHRGVRFIAIGFAVAGFANLIAAIVCTIIRPYAKLYVEPDYLYLFIKDMGAYMNHLGIIISSFAVAIGIILFGVYISMKKALESK